MAKVPNCAAPWALPLSEACSSLSSSLFTQHQSSICTWAASVDGFAARGRPARICSPAAIGHAPELLSYDAQFQNPKPQGNPKAESRRPKEIRGPKSDRNSRAHDNSEHGGKKMAEKYFPAIIFLPPPSFCLKLFLFGFRPSDFFRASGFGFLSAFGFRISDLFTVSLSE